MMRRVKKYVVLLIASALAANMCGCMSKVIAEDPIKLELPDIDPDDGLEKELAVTLYYRLANEEYLVGIDGTVSVREGERTEAAVIRGLIEGSDITAGLATVMHPDTTIRELVFEDGVLYVTLSDDFLNDDIVTSIREEDYLKTKDYNNAVRAATQEMYLSRRLGVFSIVNTVSGNGEDVKVQLFVEQGNEAKPITYEQLGVDMPEKTAVEPMTFDDSVVATGERVAGCLLERMLKGEYELAYRLVGESPDMVKPPYADFETEIRSLGTVVSYEITGSGNDDAGEYVLANVRISTPTGTVKRISNAALYVAEEGSISKVEYSSLKKLMES